MTNPKPVPIPDHPAVDKTRTRSAPEGLEVVVTCPMCQRERWQRANLIRHALRSPRSDRKPWGGYCKSCRGRSQHLSKERPPHPLVDWDAVSFELYGRINQCGIQVTCPTCGNSRWKAACATAREIELGVFTGKCRPCRRASPLNGQGYVKVSRYDMPPEDQWIYDQMVGGTGYLLGHRYAMAKHLGRALTSRELVDHMDGDKTNNAIGNLRLYRKGKNDPGSHNGYGSFYQEWQEALSEVERLKAQLEQHR